MTRSLSEQRELLEAPTLLEAVVPAARLEAAALDHAVAEGHPNPFDSINRDAVYQEGSA